MDKIIKNLMTKSLTDDDIKKTKNVNVVLYKDLAKMSDISEAFKGKDAFVLLYPGKTDNNGHWVCIIRRKGKRGTYIEHFDPYAYSIDNELSFSKMDYPPLLSELIVNSKGISHVECNKLPIQAKGKGINTCGRHALVRAMLSNLSAAQYTDLFKKQKANPDEIVTMLTAFI